MCQCMVSTSVVVMDRLGEGLVCLSLALALLPLVVVAVLGDHPHDHHVDSLLEADQ